MRNIISALIMIAGVTVATSHVRAQAPIDPERLKAADELQQSIGADAVVRNYILVQGPSLITAITQANHMPIGKAAALVNNVVLPKMMQHTDELEAANARIYAEHFTTGELAELKVFYTSPVGQKLMKTQGVIFVESKIASQKLVNDVRVSVIADLQKTSTNVGKAP